ncbi:MAG: type I methionyl aminopeptidase [Patescibacteria group bacterium]
MISIKNQREIECLRQGGKILARVLNTVMAAVRPGVSTQELNDLAEKLILEAGAEPSFKNYQGFPAVLCTSVNDQVVHAIPRPDVIIRDGDIIGLDLGLWYKDLCTDMARTVGVGRIPKESRRLIRVTERALDKAIAQVSPGNRIGDISAAVQHWVESQGFSVVRSLFGHGVGYAVHEEPRIPNYGRPHTGPVLEIGMVLAIEPMVTAGHHEVHTAPDGWSISTRDRSLAAHTEDTVVVTDDGCEILTKNSDG